jgi:AcrR family transcriptional regulator
VSEVTIRRRERKKAQTRQALADHALRLFTERGFDAVTVAQIADAADVSVSTLFAHFPSKESLVFERDESIQESFVAAVRDRPPGTSVLEALRALLVGPTGRGAAGPSRDLVRLVERTPALADHVDRMWLRHADALAEAIAQDRGADPDDVRIRAFARYVVQVPSLARTHKRRAAAIDAVFDALRDGFGEL